MGLTRLLRPMSTQPSQALRSKARRCLLFTGLTKPRLTRRICTGLGSPLPHLHRDTGSPLPHLHRDCCVRLSSIRNVFSPLLLQDSNDDVAKIKGHFTIAIPASPPRKFPFNDIPNPGCPPTLRAMLSTWLLSDRASAMASVICLFGFDVLQPCCRSSRLASAPRSGRARPRRRSHWQPLCKPVSTFFLLPSTV